MGHQQSPNIWGKISTHKKRDQHLDNVDNRKTKLVSSEIKNEFLEIKNTIKNQKFDGLRLRDCHTEWNKSEKGQSPMTSPICGIKKMIQMNLQNRNRLSDLENTLRVVRGKDGGRDS